MSDMSSGSRGSSGDRMSLEEHAPSDHAVDRYELGKTLGKGHFATVKLARNMDTGDYCALKIIEFKAAGATPRQQELFRREIAALQAIDHANVVRLKRFVAGAPYPSSDGMGPKEVLLLELELCAGGELFDFVLHGGAFPEAAARHACRELFGALAHCHSHGVYHRDLKPENILVALGPLQGDGTPQAFTLKVADFGLAVLDDRYGGASLGASPEGLCRTSVGTRSYQAPEVIAGGGSALYDAAKADAWSAACVAFILVAGSPPFTQATPTDWWFNAVRLGRQSDFWAAHQRPPTPPIALPVRAFLNRAFVADPSARANCVDLAGDPWLTGELAGAAEANCVDPAAVASAAALRAALQGQDRSACGHVMAKAAARHAAAQQAERAAALAAASHSHGQRDAVFRAQVARSAGGESSSQAPPEEARSSSLSPFAPSFSPCEHEQPRAASPPLLTDAASPLAAAMAGLGLADAKAAQGPSANAFDPSATAASGLLGLGGLKGFGPGSGGGSCHCLFTACEPAAVMGWLADAVAALSSGGAATAAGGPLLAASTLGPFALLVTGDVAAATAPRAAGGSGPAADAGAAFFSAGALSPSLLPPPPPLRGALSSGSVGSAGSPSSFDDEEEFDRSSAVSSPPSPSLYLAGERSSPSSSVSSSAGGALEGAEQATGLALRLWRLPGAGDRGVFVLEAKAQAEAKGGAPDPWALAAFWRSVVLPALATKGCPAAQAALGGGGAAFDDAAPAGAGGVRLVRLPPPREDDPAFNSDLREALAIEARGSVGHVRDDAQDDVF